MEISNGPKSYTTAFLTSCGAMITSENKEASSWDWQDVSCPKCIAEQGLKLLRNSKPYNTYRLPYGPF